MDKLDYTVEDGKIYLTQGGVKVAEMIGTSDEIVSLAATIKVLVNNHLDKKIQC